MNGSERLLSLQNISRKRGEFDSLKDINISLGSGDVAIVVGRSGSGKTSLCRVAALLDPDFSGKLEICGEDPYARKKDQIFRLAKIGYVPQFNGLIDSLTVQENISLPLDMLKTPSSNKVKDIATRLGIEHILDRFPSQISGGEAQRTAVARAVVKSPSLLVADEPLSSLDEESARIVCEVFNEFAKLDERAILVTSTAADSEVTVTLQITNRYEMREGKLSESK